MLIYKPVPKPKDEISSPCFYDQRRILFLLDALPITIASNVGFSCGLTAVRRDPLSRQHPITGVATLAASISSLSRCTQRTQRELHSDCKDSFTM